MLLPKFHCEINPIESCWVQAKRYVCAHTNYTLAGLRKSVPDGLDAVTTESIIPKSEALHVWVSTWSVCWS